jgi:RNA polymerase sigma factor (sigma-70 family)
MSSLVNQPTGDPCPEPSAAARVEQLYARHSLLVRSVCRSLLRDAVEAEDALQQTFLSAQRALLNGSSPRDDAAWLVTIARHESFARIRARMREPLPTDAEAEAVGPDAHAVAVQRHEVSELRGALAELPAPQREAILLREVRGFSYGEVASALAVTPSAVESLLFRARRSLQARLRSSLTLFPPAGFVRALAARIGGGAAVPTATKVIAVGAGAAIITGGAVTGPRILGLGQAPHGRQAASAPAVHRSTHARTAFVLPDPAGRARLTIGRVKNVAPARPATRDHSSGVDVASRPERSDQSEASSRGGSDGGGDSSTTADGGSGSSTDGGAKGSGDTQTTSSGDTNTTTDSSSQSAETQTVTETTTTTPSTDGSGG